jgi:fructosamine-3-kinase
VIGHTVALDRFVQAATGLGVARMRPLSGGSVAQVFLVDLSDGARVVAKQAAVSEGRLTIEASMLRYLAQNSQLPVPRVLYSDDQLLLIEFIAGSSRFTADAQRHAAELLATLHCISAEVYGFEYDTLIGGLKQPNPWTQSWLGFFRDQRLHYMGREALQSGRLPGHVFARLEAFGADLDRWLYEPEAPSLIHGDAWGGNILGTANRISAFLDPAIHFAHDEIELAFTTLFGTFGDSFFERYQDIRPIKPLFVEERRHIYNLYPLLVHVRLFGGGYVQAVSDTLARFGY